MMKKSSVSRSKGLRILRFCVVSWKGESEPNIKLCMGRQVGGGSKVHQNTEHWTQSTGEPMDFEWNIFTGFSTLELVREVQKFTSNMGEPEQFQGRIIFMSMFNDIIWGIKDNMRRNVLLTPHLCLYSQKNSSRTLVIPRTWVRIKVVLH